jgi:hypothetical protein
VKEYERKQLLERVDREGAIVGVDIPETVRFYAYEPDEKAEPVRLREFVFEVKKRDSLPEDLRSEAEATKKRLRRERIQRRQRIEDGDIDREEGERLVTEIVGIERALNALEGLGTETDLEAEIRRQETADQRRWRSFLNEALGNDGRSGGVR